MSDDAEDKAFEKKKAPTDTGSMSEEVAEEALGEIQREIDKAATTPMGDTSDSSKSKGKPSMKDALKAAAAIGKGLGETVDAIKANVQPGDPRFDRGLKNLAKGEIETDDKKEGKKSPLVVEAGTLGTQARERREKEREAREKEVLAAREAEERARMEAEEERRRAAKLEGLATSSTAPDALDEPSGIKIDGYDGIGAAKRALEKSPLSHSKERTSTDLEGGEVKRRAAELEGKLSTEDRSAVGRLLVAKAIHDGKIGKVKDVVGPEHTLPEVPCVPRDFKEDNTYLKQFFEQVAKMPETQTPEVARSDEKAKENTSILSKNASFLAKSMDPLDKAEIGEAISTGDDAWRKTYNVTLDREGPLYMPRKHKDGTTVKINGETQYDIIYSKAMPEGGFEVDYDRSFIAPDDIAGNSFSSVTKDIRERAWAHHKERFEAKGKIVETDKAKDFAKEAILEESRERVAEHVVPPPPPPLPPDLMSSPVPTKEAARKVASELEEKLAKRGATSSKSAPKPKGVGGVDPTMS